MMFFILGKREEGKGERREEEGKGNGAMSLI
jgi:hypothetical protein